MSYPRRSALQAALEGEDGVWGELYQMPVPLRFNEEAVERERLRDLALADLSCLPKLGVRGPGVADWLTAQGIPMPESIYGCSRLPGGGRIMRLDRREFFLEDGLPEPGRIGPLRDRLSQAPEDVYRVERQETGLLLSGVRGRDVLAQTCSFQFQAGAGQLVLTRVAVVSCMVLPELRDGIPSFRIWCAPSYGVYLWGSLLQIVRELGGGQVGLACLGTGEEGGV